MRPLRDIKRLVRHAEIHSVPEASQTVLDDLLKELAAGREDVSIRAGRQNWGSMARSPLARTAAVAALVMIVALVVLSRTSHEPVRQPSYVGEAPSAAEMLTVGRLNAACRRGGLPEIERQCEQAAQRLEARPERISVEQLIREMKGT